MSAFVALPVSVRGDEGRDERSFALGVAVLFLCVTIPVMLRHEMWRDEAQAWLLARDAPSVRALLHLLHYEGHPALWYLLLRPLARAGAGMRAMQIVALTAACGAAYLFARFAPFSRLIRSLFAFGYFVAYAYTVVARSYSIGLLLAIAVCVLLTRSMRQNTSHVWAAAAGVAALLLANVSVYGTIIVIGLTLSLVVTSRVRAGRLEPRWRGRRSLIVLPACLGIAIAVAQLRPAADASFHGAGYVVNTTSRTLGIGPLLLVWRAYVPIPNIDQVNDLGSSDALSNRSPRAAVLAIALSLAMIVMSAVLLRRSREALVFYLAATAGIVAFSVAIYPGTLYHYGHLYLVLIMALWLAREFERTSSETISAPPTIVDRHANALIVCLLAVQVIGAIPRLVGDFLYPYSGARAAALYLRAHGLDGARVIAWPAYYATPVSAYLGRPVIAAGLDAPITYTPLSHPRPELTDAQILAWARACCLAPDSTAVLLLGHRLSAPDSVLRVTPLAQFASTIVDENYYIYALRGEAR